MAPGVLKDFGLDAKELGIAAAISADAGCLILDA